MIVAYSRNWWHIGFASQKEAQTVKEILEELILKKEMGRRDQFTKVVTYSVGGEIENISPEEADLHIIKSVLKINFVLRNKLGITLKEDSAIEMFLEFIEKLNKFENKG